MCDLRKGAATSLIELEFASHTAEEVAADGRVPKGLPFSSLKASLRELDVIFLNRFVQEILRYITLLLAMRPTTDAPEALEDTPPPAGAAPAKAAAAQVALLSAVHTSTLLALPSAELQLNSLTFLAALRIG